MSASTMVVLLAALCVVVMADGQTSQWRSNETPQQEGVHLTTVQSERGKKFPKVLIPLAIILKLTSLVSATFTALKIFIIQSLVVSKVALLGATALAIKALYHHLLQHQFAHAKVSEIYPHYGYPIDWSSELTPYSHLYSGGDPHWSSNTHSRVDVPHVHSNDTISMRSDEIRSRPQPPSKPPILAYETVVTKITETTHD